MNFGRTRISAIQYFPVAAIWTTFGFFLWNCSAKSPIYSEGMRLVNLQKSEIYEYNTKIAGDEETVRIRLQARHYEISEIVRDSSTNWTAVYRYKPVDHYIGGDYVEIEARTGSDGENAPTHIKTEKIIFVIKDKVD